MTEEYYCMKCQKMHKMSYNVHYNYAVDSDKLAYLMEVGEKVAKLEKELTIIKRVLDMFETYLIRKNIDYRIKWRDYYEMAKSEES